MAASIETDWRWDQCFFASANATRRPALASHDASEIFGVVFRAWQVRQHRGVEDSHDENRVVLVHAIENHMPSDESAPVRGKVWGVAAKLRDIRDLSAA